MRFLKYLNENNVTDQAKKQGLVSIGFGRYAKKDNINVTVAKSEKGKLVFLKEPESAGAGGKGKGSGGDKEKNLELDFDGGSPAWMKQHFYKTSGGSQVIGTPHIGEKGAKRFVAEKLIPAVFEIAEEAIKSGKKVVFLAEGEERGSDDWGEDNDEQDMVALALKRKFGGKVQQDTWDDDKVRPYTFNEKTKKNSVNKKSQIFKDLSDRYDPDLVDAALAAMDAGQGTPMEFSSEAKKKLKELGVKHTDEEGMYKLTFPADSGDEQNEVSKIVDEYNKLRRNRILEKSKEIESKGGIVIATPGASHAYELNKK